MGVRFLVCLLLALPALVACGDGSAPGSSGTASATGRLAHQVSSGPQTMHLVNRLGQVSITVAGFNNVLFTPDATLFATPGRVAEGGTAEIYYSFNRANLSFHRLEALPHGVTVSRLPSKVVSQSWDKRVVRIETSDGAAYLSTQADCGELSPISHINPSKPVTDHVTDCNSVTAIERVGETLLLGTAHQIFRMSSVEQGPIITTSPGQGVVVISAKDGALIQTITTRNGLPEDIVELIRRDPYTGNVWVETPRAMTELTPNLNVIKTWYLHVDFEPQTYQPTIIMSRVPAYDNPFAVLASAINVISYKDFYLAVMKIPVEVRNQMDDASFIEPSYAETHFPTTMNVLLPFIERDVLQDTGLPRTQIALRNLCRFNDPRVKPVVSKLIATRDVYTKVFAEIHYCVEPSQIPPMSGSSQRIVLQPGGNAMTFMSTPSSGLGHPVIGILEHGSSTSGTRAAELVIKLFVPPLIVWDGVHHIHLTDVTQNAGSTPSGSSVTRYYISDTSPIDINTARVIGQRIVPPLMPGQSDTHQMEIQLPSSLPAGTYYLTACADAEHTVDRLTDQNRCQNANVHGATENAGGP